MPAVAEHINFHAIHKLMQQIERRYNIPPCADLAAYLAMLQEIGLVSKAQADEIRKLYSH